MAPQKINVKERFSDGEIDLSMSDLQDVPVKEIANFKKAFSLDLSNNNLKVLPLSFAGLTHLTKLDLSKNQLKELPENFGDLIKLKYLDLYQNQLQYLPLSFSKLKALKWLDLKDNPLVPTVAKVAGPCLDAKECQTCAKDVVNFFVQVQDQIASDLENRQKHRQKQLEINQQKQMDTKKAQKKKEKTKTKKPQNGPTIKEHVSKPSKKNKNKQEVKPSSESSTSSVLSNLFVVIFLLFFTLFVLTSINCKCTESVGKSIANFYVQSVDSMPANLQGYYVAVGSYFQLAHAKTGNVTLSVVDIVAKSINHENFASALNFLSELKENVSSKIQKIFS